MAKQNTYAPINAVANYFLLRTNVPAGDVMTHLKLQKLCYFAQAFNLVNHDCGMFKDTFQAWSHGPVAPLCGGVSRNLPGKLSAARALAASP